jgi:uncharacterized protein VirK/YbjX
MYFVPFITMARQRTYWAPQRLGRIAWSIASNLHRHIELLRIFSLPAFKSLVLLDPIFPFRHLSTQFLLPGLTASERSISLIHHYRFFLSRISKPALRRFGRGEIELIEHRKENATFSVTLGPPEKGVLWEGESLLQLRVNRVLIYQLGFTVVPGWVMHSDRRDIFFVQRLQGVKGCFDEISEATKAFGDIAPPALLVAVLQGLAAAWGIHEMACISAKSQFTSMYNRDEESSAFLKQAYDDFVLQLGAKRVSTDFFSLPLPLEEKPLDLIGNGHKARTRKKRALKQGIAIRACQAILECS